MTTGTCRDLRLGAALNVPMLGTLIETVEDEEQHHIGKENTQKIESKHINLRTRIKRLVRRTICFSKTERMHDLVIGLFINRYEFGRAI